MTAPGYGDDLAYIHDAGFGGFAARLDEYTPAGADAGLIFADEFE